MISTGFLDKFLYRSVWRNVKLPQVKNSRGQKYQHHKTKSTKQMKIILLIPWDEWLIDCVVKQLQIATNENLT